MKLDIEITENYHSDNFPNFKKVRELYRCNGNMTSELFGLCKNNNQILTMAYQLHMLVDHLKLFQKYTIITSGFSTKNKNHNRIRDFGAYSPITCNDLVSSS